MSKPTPRLATSASAPPTTSSYWAVPKSLLAGAYPGDADPAKHQQKVQLLVGAGIRTFVNLMEEAETNWAGKPFVPYQDLAVKLCPEVTCVRYRQLPAARYETDRKAAMGVGMPAEEG